MNRLHCFMGIPWKTNHHCRFYASMIQSNFISMRYKLRSISDAMKFRITHQSALWQSARKIRCELELINFIGLSTHHKTQIASTPALSWLVVIKLIELFIDTSMGEQKLTVNNLILARSLSSGQKPDGQICRCCINNEIEMFSEKGFWVSSDGLTHAKQLVGHERVI